MIELAYIVFGLIFLFVGGESLVKGSISLALSSGLSKMLISAVIIGFGTSMPEMTVSVEAALKGSPDIALGNVIGSNIANILLIVGISATLNPINIKDKGVTHNVFWMLLATTLVIVLMYINFLNYYTGTFLLIILSGYVLWSIYQEKRHSKEELKLETEEPIDKIYHPAQATLLCTVGLLGLIGGAYLLVDGAVSIARGLAVSEAVIGLTLVAFGTSLPELATAIVASFKKQSDVVVGNILGSNIFNILAILGVTSLIKPINIEPRMIHFDVWVMAAASILLAALLLFKIKIGKVIGITMMSSYIAYSLWLYLGN